MRAVPSDYDALLLAARQRPAMAVGDLQQAHLWAIEYVLGLIWQANLFQKPQAIHLRLSPHHYSVCCQSGPAARAFETMIDWEQTTDLRYPAGDIEKYTAEREKPRRGWRKMFTDSGASRLEMPAYISLLADRFVYGLKTRRGLWYQSYAFGRPACVPHVLAKQELPGLLCAAALDPQWLPGLPFTPEDAARFRGLSGLPAEVTWQEQDTLVPEAVLQSRELSLFVLHDCRS